MIDTQILKDIGAELDNQDERWGETHDLGHTPEQFIGLKIRYIGKAHAALEPRPVDRSSHEEDRRGWTMEPSLDEYRRRLIQDIALTINAIRTLDRQRGRD